jgi:arabinan endo-1,5-alpha-L-arabinosidase
MDRLTLTSPPGTPDVFTIGIDGASPHALARVFTIGSACQVLPGVQHAHYLDFYAQHAEALGIAVPLARQAHVLPPGEPALRPVLADSLSPSILYGYGDPAVTRVQDAEGRYSWRLLVTSNDAPDAFPILRSDDMREWRPTGFVFPEGRTPAWTLTGEDRADFWAPEMHQVGDEFWVVYTARAWDRALGIGLARSDSPDGPFVGDEDPLLTGGVIDPHILMVDDAPHLVWKLDTNDLWPRLLADLLHRRPELAGDLFPTVQERRAASLVLTLWPWTRTLEPMEQFFVNQPLIEAATADFAGVRRALAAVGRQAEPILEAMRTRIHAQPLSADGRSLLGEPAMLLENDQPWEAHLIEGAWITQHRGRSVLVYAGNDFSTPHYGVGLALADHPLGPYRKLAAPLLRSTCDWWGPGHPSITPGPDGRLHLFLHAFHPGRAGYKVFRALLTTGLELHGDDVRLGDAEEVERT